MKLKHAHNFARKTGSIWRLMFVFALFPWLRQYRIINDDEVINLEEELSNTELSGIDKNILLKEKIAELNAKVKRLGAINRNFARRRIEEQTKQDQRY